MTWFKPDLMIILSVIVLILVFAGLSALAQYRPRVQRALEIAERFGLKIRAFKDHQLQSSVDRIPLSADSMSWLRLAATIGCVLAFRRGLTWLAISLFIVAWTLDLFDGLKARAEQLRRGRPTPWGKYLDPGIDLVCFIGLAIVLVNWYPAWLITSFVVLITLRLVLFLIILFGRLISSRWHDSLPSNVLPESIAGKFKTVFIALSFGLIVLGRANPPTQAWAWLLLGFSLVLELMSLIQQVVRASRSVYGRSR